MQLSKDKLEVIDRLIEWHNIKSGKPISLGGYAGTGKTTLISHFRKDLHKLNPKLKVAFCAYTGKATRVLERKLIEASSLKSQDSVTTIHGLMYSPLLDTNKEIIGWQRKQALTPDMIIIDEASMVNRQIWDDLKGYGVPIFAVGDHGQLPPIEGKFNLMENPDLRITQIHRQAAQNPIIKLSIYAREEGTIPFGTFSSTVRKWNRNQDDTREYIDDLLSQYSFDTLILCGYNSTRNKLNQYVRSLLEIHSQEPISGDRVICLRNNHAKSIFNGMQATIVDIEDSGPDWYLANLVLDHDGSNYKGLIYKEQFGAEKANNYGQNRAKTLKGDLFDFGYALTVHKAQGSQAKRVILFEERFSRMDDDDWRKWLYTAVTRAEEELYIFGY